MFEGEVVLDGELLGVGSGVGVNEGDTVFDGELDGEKVRVGDLEGVGLEDGVTVGEDDRDGVNVGVNVLELDAVLVRVPDGDTVCGALSRAAHRRRSACSGDCIRHASSRLY